jgi:hypothetical protein
MRTLLRLYVTAAIALAVYVWVAVDALRARRCWR